MPQTSPPKAKPLFSKHSLWYVAWGCDNELDGDADDDGGNFPDSGAGLGAIMTAEVRRPRTTALAVIALSLSGV